MKKAAQVRAVLRLADEKSDFHIAEVKRVARVPKGRYEDNEAHELVRVVKSVAPFDIWTVWERPGWHSSQTTFEVRAVAFYRSAQANATAMTFLSEILWRHRRADSLSGEARMASGMSVKIKELFESDLPSPGREDSTLARIDQRIANGEGK
jgi:hypothetical protein